MGRITHLALGAALVVAASVMAPTADAVTTAPGYPWADFDADGRGDAVIAAPGEAIGSTRGAGAVHVLYGTSSGLSASGDQLWHQDSPGVPGNAERGDAFGSAVAAGDFDKDGFDDLAIGSPGEGIGSAESAGSVTVLYGTANGLRTSGAQLLRQGTEGISGSPQDGDAFGVALASGTINSEPAADLAIGVPGQDVAGKTGAGMVVVLYGANAVGLSSAAMDQITQNTNGIAGGAEKSDAFGFTLTTGDLDATGRDEVIVSTPFEDVSGQIDAGSIHTIGGAAGGVDPHDSVALTQNDIFDTNQADDGDWFGFALGSGNLDPAQGGHDDLVVGVPNEFSNDSGAINVLFGSDNGLVSTAQTWYQGATGSGPGAISGTRESRDGFGFSVSVNDLGGVRLGAADIAVGVPGENLGSRSDAGGVNVIYSDGDSGPAPGQGPNQFWSQNSSKVGGEAESRDFFGGRLASGDFNGDGVQDLVVGTPGENVGSIRDAGAATVLYSAGTRLSGSGSDSWTQNTSGIKGGAELEDFFGGALG